MSASATMTTRPPATIAGDRLIDGDPAVFRERFNRAEFAFTHRLANHPLFELPRLIELAKSMPAGDIYYDAGEVRVDQRWDQTPPCLMPVDELLRRIESDGAWILIKRARRDPEYAELLDRGLAEFQELTGGELPTSMMKRDALVFITSPHRITPYHIDRECNFLLQIRGEKVIHIFDRYDREILPEKELERFWTVDNNSAVYKPEYQDRAHVYDLKPGSAVHIPVNAPHWVRNGEGISVSLSVNFQYQDATLANIYRTNYLLRKVGMKPRPPGRSKLGDVVKGRALGPAFQLAKKFKIKRALKGLWRGAR
jgi:hypothetical protein